MIGSALKLVRDGLLSAGYPSNCRLCNQPVESWDDGVVCGDCWTDPDVCVTFRGLPLCPRCGFAPLSKTLAYQSGLSLCGQCEQMPLHALRSVGLYRGSLEASVLFLKSTPHVCPRLCGLIEAACDESARDLSSDIIVPVPLHAARKRERGFNQASVIARALSKILHSPVDEKVLVRAKHTERHRAGMDSFDRSKSISGALQISSGDSLRNRRVLLVDDLCTTGSTLSEAARVLLNSGASRVSAFTIARAAFGFQS
ncbi:MAG TPA: phosphoribosyltransferase family protein [Blastocatellia bacterium]